MPAPRPPHRTVPRTLPRPGRPGAAGSVRPDATPRRPSAAQRAAHAGRGAGLRAARWVGLAWVALLVVACSEPAGRPSRSLLDTVELGRRLALDPAATAPVPHPLWVGWGEQAPEARSVGPRPEGPMSEGPVSEGPVSEGPGPQTVASEAPPAVGSLLLGRTARTVLWLAAGERLELPLPRATTPRRLRVDVGRAAGKGDLGLRFDLAGGAGEPRVLLEVASPSGLSAEPGTWSPVEVALPSDLRGGVDRLGVTLVGAAADTRLGLGGLRLVPEREARVGPDLLLVCDELAGDDAPSSAPTAAAPFDPCWSQSPDPGLALASLLAGGAPTIHSRPTPAGPRARTLGLPGRPATVGTLLRGAGYHTLALVEQDSAAAARPTDLGFDTLRLVSPGQALTQAQELLDGDAPGSWAVLVVRAASGPTPDRTGADGARPRVVVHTALARRRASEGSSDGASADDGARGPGVPPADEPGLEPADVSSAPEDARRPAFDEHDVRVPFTLVVPGLAYGPSTVARPVLHLDLLPTLCALLDLDAPPGLEGRALLRREPAGGLRLAPPDEDRLLWAALPGRTYLLGKGVRRTAWVPTADGVGREWTVDRVAGLELPIEATAARADAVRARVAALEAIGRALYGPAGD